MLFAIPNNIPAFVHFLFHRYKFLYNLVHRDIKATSNMEDNPILNRIKLNRDKIKLTHKEMFLTKHQPETKF